MALADLDDLLNIDGKPGAGIWEDFSVFGDLSGANVVGCRVDPAETVACLNGEGINYIDTDFVNMAAGNPLILGSQGTLNANNVAPARYTNVDFEGIGGELTINNAVVYGLNTSGNFTVNLQSGYLNDWQLNGDSNVILRTQGGTIRNLQANGAILDERSSLNGGFFLGGEFNGTLRNIDARGAQFSDGIHITGDISGDFSNARFSNCSMACDPRNMQISDSTSFFGVNMFNPQTGQYQRIDSRDQFEAIGRAYALTDQIRENVLPQMSWAQEQEQAAARAAATPNPVLGMDAAVAALSSNGQTIAPVLFTPTPGVALDTKLPVPDAPMELTAPPQGGDSVRTLIVGGENFASISDIQADRQGANENQLTLNTPEAQEALAQITDQAMGEGYMR